MEGTPAPCILSRRFWAGHFPSLHFSLFVHNSHTKAASVPAGAWPIPLGPGHLQVPVSRDGSQLMVKIWETEVRGQPRFKS